MASLTCKFFACSICCANRTCRVVNNAGICSEARNPQPIDQVDEDAFDAHLRINTRGVFLGSKYSVQQFLKQEPRANGMRGWIINFASMVSNIGMQGLSKKLAQ